MMAQNVPPLNLDGVAGNTRLPQLGTVGLPRCSNEEHILGHHHMRWGPPDHESRH